MATKRCSSSPSNLGVVTARLGASVGGAVPVLELAKKKVHSVGKGRLTDGRRNVFSNELRSRQIVRRYPEDKKEESRTPEYRTSFVGDKITSFPRCKFDHVARRFCCYGRNWWNGCWCKKRTTLQPSESEVRNS